MTPFEERLKLLAPAPASDRLRARLAAASRRARLGRLLPMGAAAAGLAAALAFVILKGSSGSLTTAGDAVREFRRVEQALLEAKTIEVLFERVAELRGPGGIERVETSGSLLLKEGNKMRLALTEVRAPGRPEAATSQAVYFCSGAHGESVLKLSPGKSSLTNTAIYPKDLMTKMALSLARESPAVPISVFTADLGDVRSRLDLSGFSKATDAQGRPTLGYRIGGYDVQLWYDPQTLVPLRRTLTNKDVGTITETYTACRLNVPIPDERITPE